MRNSVTYEAGFWHDRLCAQDIQHLCIVLGDAKRPGNGVLDRAVGVGLVRRSEQSASLQYLAASKVPDGLYDVSVREKGYTYLLGSDLYRNSTVARRSHGTGAKPSRCESTHSMRNCPPPPRMRLPCRTNRTGPFGRLLRACLQCSAVGSPQRLIAFPWGETGGAPQEQQRQTSATWHPPPSLPLLKPHKATRASR